MRWALAALAILMVWGCQSEPEGTLLVPPTQAEAEAMAADSPLKRFEFKPGVYTASELLSKGQLTVKFTLRPDKTVEYQRILTGAEPLSETMTGAYTFTDGVVDIRIKKVNGEDRERSELLIVLNDALVYTADDNGLMVQIPLEVMETFGEAASQTPDQNPDPAPSESPGA